MVKHHMVTGMHMTIESLRTQTLQVKNAHIIVNRCRMTLFCSWYLIFLLFSLNLFPSMFAYGMQESFIVFLLL